MSSVLGSDPRDSEIQMLKTLLSKSKQRELELMARVARLEKALDYAGVKLLEHKDRRAYEYVDKLLCEEAPQSLAEIRAEAVLQFAARLLSKHRIDVIDEAKTDADQLRQQADKG